MYLIRFSNGNDYKGSVVESFDHAKSILAEFISRYGYSGDPDQDQELIDKISNMQSFDEIVKFIPHGELSWISEFSFGDEICFCAECSR